MSEEIKNENAETAEVNKTQIIEDEKPKETVEASPTEAPVKEESSTEAPATEASSTEASSTEAPATETPATEAPAKGAPAARGAGYQKRDTRPDSNQARRGQGRERGNFQGQQRYPKFRRKICKFCYEKELKIDYKDSTVLEHYITDRGKILPRRVTGTCSKHQRSIARAIKRARIIALLPFVEQ